MQRGERVVKRQDLIGAWGLEEWVIDYSDGRPLTRPYGERPQGLLLFTPTHFSGVLSREKRPAMAVPNSSLASDTEKARAFDGYFHYSGTWTIEGGKLVNRTLHALDPTFLGTTQVREIGLSGDRMTLVASMTTPSGAIQRNRLTWVRLPE